MTRFQGRSKNCQSFFQWTKTEYLNTNKKKVKELLENLSAIKSARIYGKSDDIVEVESSRTVILNLFFSIRAKF